MIDNEKAKIGIYLQKAKSGWTVTLSEFEFKQTIHKLEFETLEELSKNWDDYKEIIDEEIMRRLST